MHRKDTRRGSTLIELLVVVLIVGILAAVAMPQYQKAVDKSRFMQLLLIADAIKQSQERYYLEHGEYATSKDDLDIKIGDNSLHPRLNSCTQSAPASTYLTWDKLPGVLLFSGYQHQCVSVGWSNQKGCYASPVSTRANHFCANVTKRPVQKDCNGFCIYYF